MLWRRVDWMVIAAAVPLIIMGLYFFLSARDTATAFVQRIRARHNVTGDWGADD